MRIDIRETKVYPFDELSDEAKQKALKELCDINVYYNWWESIYADAANVGIKITAFDIDRNSYCKGDFCEDAEDVAKKIMAEHGKDCETYKTATTFLAAVKAGKKAFENSAERGDLEYNETSDYENLVEEFEEFILEDYRIMLQKEYESLISEEAILETIKANEYEFTEDGKLY